MEEKIIRGRRVICERNGPKPQVEYLRYTLDVFDQGDNLVAVLGRVADSRSRMQRSRPPSRSIPTSASASASDAA